MHELFKNITIEEISEKAAADLIQIESTTKVSHAYLLFILNCIILENFIKIDNFWKLIFFRNSTIRPKKIRSWLRKPSRIPLLHRKMMKAIKTRLWRKVQFWILMDTLISASKLLHSFVILSGLGRMSMPKTEYSPCQAMVLNSVYHLWTMVNLFVWYINAKISLPQIMAKIVTFIFR